MSIYKKTPVQTNLNGSSIFDDEIVTLAEELFEPASLQFSSLVYDGS
jgi:hypothetical protein